MQRDEKTPTTIHCTLFSEELPSNGQLFTDYVPNLFFAHHAPDRIVRLCCHLDTFLLYASHLFKLPGLDGDCPKFAEASTASDVPTFLELDALGSFDGGETDRTRKRLLIKRLVGSGVIMSEEMGSEELRGRMTEDDSFRGAEEKGEAITRSEFKYPTKVAFFRGRILVNGIRNELAYSDQKG